MASPGLLEMTQMSLIVTNKRKKKKVRNIDIRYRYLNHVHVQLEVAYACQLLVGMEWKRRGNGAPL